MDIFLESFFYYLNIYFIQIKIFLINIIFTDILNRGTPSSSSKELKTVSQGIVLLYYFNFKVKYFDKIGCVEKYSIFL